MTAEDLPEIPGWIEIAPVTDAPVESPPESPVSTVTAPDVTEFNSPAVAPSPHGSQFVVTPPAEPPPAEPIPQPSPQPRQPMMQPFVEEVMGPLPEPKLNGPPWWTPVLARPQRRDPSRSIHLGELITSALLYSQYVRAVSLQPDIVETDILTRQAEFDPATFLDSTWQDFNDPVGNTLTTGGATRFNNHNFQNRGGMRKKMTSGATLEAAQEIGLQDTNSIFFQPGNQGQTRMVLTYNQPLWRNSGECYNQSLIVLAEIDTRAATADLQRQLQDHVYKVVEAYQDLCLQRAWYLQRVRARDKVLGIQRELEARRELDAVDAQILRARANVAARTAALARAEAGVRNAETRLRTLTNAPEINTDQRLEILPIDAPAHQFAPPALATELQEALRSRPEISVTLEKIKAGEVKVGMATNELKPTLNLLLEGYVRGLKGGYDVASSFGAQFSEGSPSYTTGIVYEAAWGNRAAQSRLKKRNLELQQLMHEFQNSLQTISAEVEIAAREVEATHREMMGNTITAHATEAETDHLLQRWRRLAGDDRNASILLEDALNAQDRLVAAEAALAGSQRDYALSLAALKKATGRLLAAQPHKPNAETVPPPIGAPGMTRLPPLHAEVR